MIQKKQFLVLPILIILICIVFYPVIFQGKVFSSPDSLNPKAAVRILEKTQQDTGEYPLWQPWIFSGMPTTESFTNTSNLYLPQFLFKLFHIPASIVHLLHFIFAGLGVYILLRYLKLSQYIATIGAAAFMLMPYLITMEVFGHGSQAMTAAYIPWAFWAGLKLFNNKKLLDAGLLALILGLQLQRAHVQIAYYTWMLIGALFLFKIILYMIDQSRRPEGGVIGVYFIISIMLALGISALVYLPSVQYSSESIRSVGQAGSASFDYATSWSFHPKEMLTFLIPSAFGFGGQTYWGNMPFTDYPNYMGIIILILSIIAFIKNKDKLVWFLGVTSLLAVLIAFGRHWPFVYNLFYNIAPYFNKFRVPSMILILLQFNTVILAAIGLQRLIELEWKEIPKWFWWTAGTAGILAIILILGNNFLRDIVSQGFTQPRTNDPRYISLINDLRWKLWYQDFWIALLFIFSLIGVFYLLVKEKINKIVFTTLIGCLIIADLLVVDFKIVQPAEGSGRATHLINKKAIERYFKQDAITSYLSKEVGNFRVYPLGNLFGDSRLQAFGIESVGGYHPAKLAIYNEFLSNTNNISTLQLMRMMNIRFILSPQVINHPDLKQVYNDNMQTASGRIPIWIYAISEPIERAWFVDNVEVVGDNELWQKLMDESFNPIKTAFIVEDFTNKTIGGGVVLSSNYLPNHISLDVETDQGGFLVISEVNYPLRWKSYIDDEEVNTIETNGIIRGLWVDAGKHTIEFSYDKSVFNKGRSVSIISTILALSLIIIGYIRNKNELV